MARLGPLVDGAPAGDRPDDFWNGRYACADGRWVHFSGSTPRFRQRLVEAAGNQRWRDEGLLDLARLRADATLAADLRARLRALFQTRAAEEWEDLGAAANTPITVCRTAAEWIETPHARAAGIVCRVDDPRLGPTWQPGPPVRLSEWDDGGGEPAAPRQTEGSETVAWAAPRSRVADGLEPRSAESREGQARMGAPPRLAAVLTGVRVVDLTQVLAGPTAGRTLAEFGADVVKINNPAEEGAGYRTSVHRYHTDVNRAKRTMLLDLKSRAGLDVAYRLLDGADVVLQNFRRGVAERLGIGYEQIRQRRPDLVYVSVSAFG